MGDKSNNITMDTLRKVGLGCGEGEDATGEGDRMGEYVFRYLGFIQDLQELRYSKD